MKFREGHECSFTHDNIDLLFPLPPNSTRIARFFRAIRAFCSLDPKSVKCKEFFRNKSTMFAEQKRHARSSYRFVIHPFSKMNRTLEAFFFCAWLWHYFSVPIVNGFLHESDTTFLNLRRVMDLFQVVVFISFFSLGYVDMKKREIILDPKKIFLHYLTTYFIVDLIAIFYNNFVLLFLDEDKLLFEHFPQNYSTILIATAAYFIRYKYFVAILRNGIISLRIPKKIYTLCYHIITTGLILHIFTCTMFSIPRLVNGVNFPPGSWMLQAGVHKIDEVYFLDLYSESLIMAVCFFFGVSFDKYLIIQPEEELVLTFTTIFGRLYTLYMIADILKSFGLVSVSESKYEQCLGQLEEYMISKNLPDELRIRLLKYYDYKLQKHYFDEGQILATLSETLKTEVFLFGARKLIQKAHVLKSLPRTTLAALIALMKSETFLQMDVITKSGSKVENVYFISNGTVAVFNSQNMELTHLEDGDEFGFLVTPDGKQLLTHIAAETSEIFYIPKKILMEFLRQHPDVMKYFDSRVKKKLEKYGGAESVIRRGGDDVLSSLRDGNLLESQKIRDINIEFSS